MREILFVHAEHQAFRDHRDAVESAVAEPLENRTRENVDDPFQADAAAAEFLGDERQRRARRLSDAEREVTGFSAHRDDEVPARRGLGVHHQVLEDLDAVMTGRLEAERVDVRRQVEIVVDRLRHVRHADPAAGPFFELHGGVRGVIAADRDELRDVQPQERRDGVLEVLLLEARIRA